MIVGGGGALYVLIFRRASFLGGMREGEPVRGKRESGGGMVNEDAAGR